MIYESQIKLKGTDLERQGTFMMYTDGVSFVLRSLEIFNAPINQKKDFNHWHNFLS